jgi:hypothetical protein
MKDTITTNAPIPGWDCTWVGEGEGSVPGHYTCTPSDDYIRERAYFRFVTQSPPGATPFANWITAEEDFIVAGGNELPPL